MNDVLATLLPGFTGPRLPPWMADALAEGLGGVCLFASNIGSTEQLRELVTEIRHHNPRALITLDEEGGDVTRLFHHRGGSPFPGNGVLGRIDDVEVTATAARRLAEAVLVAGVGATFAPVADVNSEADNPVIGTRSFGSDAELVARHVAAWVGAARERGLVSCAKHFPGHGDTDADSHVALPVVRADLGLLRRRELRPFAAAIEAGVEMMMTSHLVVPALDPERPATFSTRILGELLREELGFTGVVVSDALDMAGASATSGIPQAAVCALAAGCDLLCLGASTDERQLAEVRHGMTEAVATGALSADRLREAAERVRALGGRQRDLGVAGPDTADLQVSGLAEALARAEPSTGDLQRIAASFALSPAARSELDRLREDRAGAAELGARAERGEQAGSGRSVSGPPVVIVTVETEANIAVGDVAWGPAALLAGASPAPTGADLPATADIEHPVPVELRAERLRAGQTQVPCLAPEALVLAVVRDLHRHPGARSTVEALRTAHWRTLVVDLGWTPVGSDEVDVATYGASRAVSRAVLGLICGEWQE